MKADKDHISSLVRSEPKVRIHAVIRKLKQETTNLVLETQNEYLKKYCLKKYTLWGNVHFPSSINDVSKEAARNYIQNQG
jgi:REP element-mobilizing transposase RayT